MTVPNVGTGMKVSIQSFSQKDFTSFSVQKVDELPCALFLYILFYSQANSYFIQHVPHKIETKELDI